MTLFVSLPWLRYVEMLDPRIEATKALGRDMVPHFELDQSHPFFKAGHAIRDGRIVSKRGLRRVLIEAEAHVYG